MIIPGPKVQVVIQEVSQVSDGMGSTVDTYTTRHTVYGGLHSLTAKERMEAGKETGVITNRLFLVYVSDLELSDRVTYGGNTYEILAIVNPGTKGEHLELDLSLIK